VRCAACGATTPVGEPTCRRCGNDLVAPERWREQTGELDERTEVIVEGPALVATTPARPPGRRRYRLRGLVLVLVGLVLLSAGVVVGYQAGRRAPESPAAVASSGISTTAPAPSAARPAPTPNQRGLVQVAPALAQRPETAEVRRLLTAYFTAINRRDFDAYRETLVTRTGLPETEAEFQRRYRSTVDSDVRLLGLRSDGEAGYVASVAFTSRQDPVDAPDGGSDCLRWSIAFPLVATGDTLRIEAAGLATVVRRPC